MCDEVATLLQRIDDSLARKTLKGARLARLFYNVARVYVKTDAGHAMKPHVEEMKRSLTRPRRRKPATPSVPDDPSLPEDVRKSDGRAGKGLIGDRPPPGSPARSNGSRGSRRGSHSI